MKTSYFCLIFCQLCFVFANEFDLGSISTRHLLSHDRIHSSSLNEKKTSQQKHLRTGSNEKSLLPVYVRPSKSSTHKHPTKSYADLLTSKTKKKSKKNIISKKKKPVNKQKNETIIVSKARELVPINDAELQRCQILLNTKETVPTLLKNNTKTLTSKETKSKKKTEDKPIETLSPKKKIDIEKPNPIKTEENKAKKSSENPALNKNEENSPTNKVDENRSKKAEKPKNDDEPTKKPKNDEEPPKKSKNEEEPIKKPKNDEEPPKKSKNEEEPAKKAKNEEEPTKKAEKTKNDESKKEEKKENLVESDEQTVNHDETPSNNSVVDRAFHFVKNIFQLSDDSFESDSATKDNSNDEQEQSSNRQSRKLLSIENFDDQFDNSMLTSISKRNLLSHKEKKSVSNKEKKTVNSPTNNDNNNKPKVGWAYRYRISRYLAAQKQQQQAGKRTKTSNEKISLKSKEKKTKSSNDRKTSKRKLLQVDQTDSQISNQDLIDSVTITQPFRPKRLHKEKPADARPPSTADDLKHESYRLKYSDPILLVPSHEAQIRQEKTWTNNGEIRQKAKKKFNRKEKSTKHSSESDDSTKKNDQNSSSLLQKLFFTARRSSCFLPFAKDAEFCQISSSKSIETRRKKKNKLRTKKEHLAKQFIRSRPTKLGAEDKATERRVDDLMKLFYSKASLPPVENRRKESKSNVETSSPVRLRTISEVIREQADVFLAKNRQDLQTSEQIQEENAESFAEKKKIRSLDRNKDKH